MNFVKYLYIGMINEIIKMSDIDPEYKIHKTTRCLVWKLDRDGVRLYR